jgi:ADP-ribose pyrophosphatase YjhB (NUDIX family)
MMNKGTNEKLRPIKDGEELVAEASGGTWRLSWHPVPTPPDGTRHGANGICITTDGGLVLISEDNQIWGLPGGRPEGDETWEETLRREMLEEACVDVGAAQLLGFSRGVSLSGPETGLVLVRSWWRAEVEVGDWEPRFEIPHRQVVPSQEWPAHVWIPEGFEPVVYRAFKEAGLNL